MNRIIMPSSLSSLMPKETTCLLEFANDLPLLSSPVDYQRCPIKMVKFAKTYVLVDMGVAHVLTTDRKCIQLAYARPLLGTGELCEFQTLEDAYDRVESLRSEGCYWQLFDANKVPWDKPPIDYSEPQHDWSAIKELIRQILEVAKDSEMMRDEARSMGVSYEDFLAAAITQLISKEIEE